MPRIHRLPHVIVIALSMPCALAPALAPRLDAQEKSARKDPGKPLQALTPEDAGADFAIQGEYTGEIDAAGGKAKLGIQVIARGAGSFEAVGHRGGLPGDGWDGGARPRARGKRGEEGVTVFEKFDGDRRIEIRDGKLRVADAAGKAAGTLERVLRKSPTLGARPPEGAVVLFDGKGPGDFVRDGRRGKESGPARLSAAGHLLPRADTLRRHGDGTLHLEFLLPFEPAGDGQGRGNSGCYLQGRYEVQILDSFGLESTTGDCGGIYSYAPPKVNLCYPPLSWQTYDIDFTAARFDAAGKRVSPAKMTVRHNGVLIHDAVVLGRDKDAHTTAAPNTESPEKSFLHLQDHGHPVQFRNIWLLER